MNVYTVKEVKDRKEWSGNYGPMVTYVMDVEDENGQFSPKVELNRKPESREPQIGERFAGHLEETNFAEKLKVDFEATKELGGSRPSGSTETKTSNNSKSSEVDWDAKEARIQRQVALKIVAPLIIEEKGLHRTTKEIVEEIETFISEAGQSPEQPVDLSGARKDEPSAPDVNRDHIMQLLSSAGLTFAAAQEKVADFIMGPLTIDGRIGSALSGLQDLDRQSEVLAKLTTQTVAWTGSPLPHSSTVPDDDIPF